MRYNIGQTSWGQNSWSGGAIPPAIRLLLWINGGIYLINRSLLQVIPEGAAISLERDLFPSWVGQGLYGYCNGEQFLDIGIPEAYAAAGHFFSKGGLP